MFLFVDLDRYRSYIDHLLNITLQFMIVLFLILKNTEQQY
jgi:hypothetical protein